MSKSPTVKGKWLVPGLILGFVAFTVAMSLATIALGKAMRPTLERRQIEAQKAQMAREARDAAARK